MQTMNTCTYIYIYIWYMMYDIWYMIYDIWCMIYDIWYMILCNIYIQYLIYIYIYTYIFISNTLLYTYVYDNIYIYEYVVCLLGIELYPESTLHVSSGNLLHSYGSHGPFSRWFINNGDFT